MQRDLFAERADPALLPEKMDEPCSYEEFRGCLRDLAEVNVVTRAYRPTLGWLAQFAAKGEPLEVLDVGSGGADMLRQVAREARLRGWKLKLTGIDLNPHSTRAAREFSREFPEIKFVTGDALRYLPERPVDVVLSSLMTHHLREPEIVELLRWMEATARRGWFINDLYRSERASKWFGVVAELIAWHEFVQHDGPVSVRRAFREEDWKRMCASAGIAPEKIALQRHFGSRLTVGRVK